MSNTLSIAVENRELLGTANSRRMRRNHIIPAVLYGLGDNINLAIPESSAEKVAYHSGMVVLKNDNGVKNAIVKDVQRHVISNQILCMDFLEVDVTKVVVVSVPIRAIGVPAGVQKGGQLEQTIHDIRIECLPANVPELLEFDVSKMNMDEVKHVSDLELEDGLKAVEDPGMIVFQVRIPQVEIEEEAEEAAAAAEATATAAAAAPAAGADAPAADKTAPKK
ncbi:MAG: 50S ribosomal protein L25 [Lentisphaeria bacterium]